MSNIRVNVYFDEELLEIIDAYTKEHFMNRSEFIAMCCKEHIDADKMLPEVRGVFSRVLSDTALLINGEISQEEYDQRWKAANDEQQELKKKMSYSTLSGQ